jgi:hypothetical protein
MNVYAALEEREWPGETKVLGQNPVVVPLCTPQILTGLAWDRTGTSSVRRRRPTVCDTARLIATAYSTGDEATGVRCWCAAFMVCTLMECFCSYSNSVK